MHNTRRFLTVTLSLAASFLLAAPTSLALLDQPEGGRPTKHMLEEELKYQPSPVKAQRYLGVLRAAKFDPAYVEALGILPFVGIYGWREVLEGIVSVPGGPALLETPDENGNMPIRWAVGPNPPAFLALYVAHAPRGPWMLDQADHYGNIPEAWSSGTYRLATQEWVTYVRKKEAIAEADPEAFAAVQEHRALVASNPPAFEAVQRELAEKMISPHEKSMPKAMARVFSLPSLGQSALDMWMSFFSKNRAPKPVAFGACSPEKQAYIQDIQRQLEVALLTRHLAFMASPAFEEVYSGELFARMAWGAEQGRRASDRLRS